MKIRFLVIIPTSLLAFLIIPIFVFADRPSISGKIEGVGTNFEVTDSEYLNISLQSTEEIAVLLESIPQTISLLADSSTSTNSTVLTIVGLKPNTSYYKYTDSYRNEEIITTDADGKYIFLQELTQSHHIWFQESSGTVFLPRNCSNYGIWEELSSTCTLAQNLNQSVEIELPNITLDCAGHNITGNNAGFGIYLYNKSGVSLKNCIVGNFSYGISLWNSDDGNFNSNTASNNGYGIFLWQSNSAELTDNTASSNRYDGTSLNYSDNAILIGNEMLGNRYNFGVTGSYLSNYVHSINTTNIVDGKPIYYWINEENRLIPDDAGFVGIVNSTNITVKDLTLANNLEGILVAFSNNTRVENVTSSDNLYGIYLNNSTVNTLTDNTLFDNQIGIGLDRASYRNLIERNNVLNNVYGISLENSSSQNIINGNEINSNYEGIFAETARTDTRITNNNVTLNKRNGIYLGYSSNYSTVEDNNIELNEVCGIKIWQDSYDNIVKDNNLNLNQNGICLGYLTSVYHGNNKIFHNNFIDNIYQASIQNATKFIFDNSYPINFDPLLHGGNHWFDYTGVDLYKGQNQNELGSDGIGDTFYTFTGGQDRYPFMEENGWLIVPPQEFWVGIQNALLGAWNLRQGAGLDKPILKVVPNDWVVKVLNTTTILIDGYYWYKIQDATDGTLGFMAGKDTVGTEYLPYDSNKQTEFEEKASRQLTTKNERVDKIIESVNRYYNNASTIPSLYSSNDGTNYLSIFKENNFPEELILAIAAAESGGHNFDNEIVNTTDDQWGRGIMQIDYPNTYVGLGSGLGWYKNGQLNSCRNEATRDCSDAICHSDACEHYYTNTHQGIFVNIKDGFRVLQEKHQTQNIKPVATTTIDNLVITPDDLQKILTTWRYNGFIESTYLLNVANKLSSLSLYFPGITYNNPEFIDKINKVNQHQERFLAHSPINLYAIDFLGRMTGLTSIGIKEEIPNSGYDSDTGIGVLLFPDYYLHQYEVVGTADGTFGLTIDSIVNNNPIAFNAVDIPILTNEVQTYSIDWQKLSQDQESVTIQIDTNGDGVFDEYVVAGKEFTNDDIILQTETVIDLNPDVLNLKSKGNSITVYIELSQGFDVKQINISSIMLNDLVPTLSKPTFTGDYNNNGIPDLMVKFNRQSVQNVLTQGNKDKVKITISGRLKDGRLFSGADTIKVISSADSASNVALASVDGSNGSSLVIFWQQIQTFFSNIFHWFWNGITSLISSKQPPTTTSTPTVTLAPSPSPTGLLNFSWVSFTRGTENVFLNPANSNVSTELHSILLIDMPIFTDACTGSGHTKILSEDYYTTLALDLNDDSINEFLIFPVQVCGWILPGASGNGTSYIYQKIDGIWKKIGNLDGGSFALEEEKTAGFKNIVTSISLGVGAKNINYYQWNQSKSEYEFIKQEYYEWNKDKSEYELKAGLGK